MLALSPVQRRSVHGRTRSLKINTQYSKAGPRGSYPVDWIQVGEFSPDPACGSDRPEKPPVRGPTALFFWGAYISLLAGHGSLSWIFLLRKYPSEPSQSSLTHIA